jgi:D-serine deaminase-like pyridoxal phosphate-dependent protein
VRCSEELRADGLACPVVSIGSTPTATFTENLTGITEVRAGVHMFLDLVMAGIGVCEVSDIALSVLTSVIGHQKEKGWVIVDAGWMALSRDRGTAFQQVDQGYGVVCDIHGDVVDNLLVEAVDQEHGIVTHRAGEKLDPDRFPVGSMLRILPNHACATGAMHNSYRVIDGGTQVLAEWQRTAGW